MRNDKTVAEFFAGIGLMRIGLEQAGWRVVWANDIDENKFRMYKGHFTNDHARFLVGDVHAIPPDALPNVTLATASFPCNDLSLAGARQGLSGRQSGAFWGFINVIKGMKDRRPPIVLLENVTGFLTSREGNDFRDACLALNKIGYSVDAFIIDAAWFVPQSRQRLFLVGMRRSEADYAGDVPSFYQSQCRPSALADFVFCHPEIRWAMHSLPSIPKTTTTLRDILEKKTCLQIQLLGGAVIERNIS